MDNFVYYSLPPHGGSGLKSSPWRLYLWYHKSPSTRREWIEMMVQRMGIVETLSPSTRREWIEMSSTSINTASSASPSTRREWIEIVL